MEVTPLVSLRVEKHVLAGLIKYPNAFMRLNTFITSDDFDAQVHQVIFSVLSQLIITQTTIDKVVLAQKIAELGIQFKDNINIFDYVENMSLIQINEEGVVKAAQELARLKVKREIDTTADLIKDYIRNRSKDDTIDEIIAEADSIHNRTIRNYVSTDEPVAVFENLAEMVEERASNPREDVGLLTPYPEFNRLFGGLRNGNVYAIVSRPAQGKTTWIDDICLGVSRLTHNRVPVLILDTEMATVDIQFRLASSMTGVPLWYLETGRWKRYPDFVDKVTKAFADIKKFNYYHYHVGNRNIDQILTIIRRFYYTKVGRGNQMLCAYDYIKLTGENVGENWAEHQAIGEKIDKLKKISEELNFPLVTAMQMNRAGENQNRQSRDVVDDATAIALSDRLQWYATFVAIFRRKTLDEMEVDGLEFGTHKLIPTKTRFQGKDAAGHLDLVVLPQADGSRRYVNNYLNFKVENFHVEEKGSLRDIIKRSQQQFQVRNEANKKADEVALE